MRIFAIILALNFAFGNTSQSQPTELTPGKTIQKKLNKGETHVYSFTLKKGEYAACTINQKNVMVQVDLTDVSGKHINSFSLTEGYVSFPVSIEASQPGIYRLNVHPLLIPDGMIVPDSVRAEWENQNQGDYMISDITKLSPDEYKKKLESEHKQDAGFISWIDQHSHEITHIDAGSGFNDLQPLKSIWRNVQVVGLGEATHGTSEFFRFKHRMLEFLAKEMGYTSFLIEASATRCRYINDYVLYGRGNLDTATAIQGFITWRVEEVRDLIEWMRIYNQSVPDESKIKFFGYDLQINDMGWKELKQYYSKLNAIPPVNLDSLNIQLDTAAKLANDFSKQEESRSIFESAHQQGLAVLNDLVMNEAQYRYQLGDELYNRNLMNQKLIVQQILSYSVEDPSRRDYYMAQNIVHLLNQYPGTKALVWAHNGHIGKQEGMMGGYLNKILGNNYYCMGFEFYSGSFQSRNLDIGNTSTNWDIVTVNAPPEKSLPWYMNQTGKENYYIDFRYIQPDDKSFISKTYPMHSYGSVYSSTMPVTYPAPLNGFDGLIFIRKTQAAKNFNKVVIP